MYKPFNNKPFHQSACIALLIEHSFFNVQYRDRIFTASKNSKDIILVRSDIVFGHYRLQMTNHPTMCKLNVYNSLVIFADKWLGLVYVFFDTHVCEGTMGYIPEKCALIVIDMTFVILMILHKKTARLLGQLILNLDYSKEFYYSFQILQTPAFA